MYKKPQLEIYTALQFNAVIRVVQQKTSGEPQLVEIGRRILAATGDDDFRSAGFAKWACTSALAPAVAGQL